MKELENNIREIIIERYGSLNKFCSQVDMPWTTLDSILKRGISKANVGNVIKIAKELDLDTDALSEGFIVSRLITNEPLSASELELIKKYRVLDRHGKVIVDTVLDLEYERCSLEPEYIAEGTRFISFYNTKVSAGNGSPLFEDIPIEQLAIPDDSSNKRVAYALGVNGDSMTPKYQDGDVLLVEPASVVNKGEIGIFLVDGQAYVKKLGDGVLISLNSAYDSIPLTEDSRCMGRVIGKL